MDAPTARKANNVGATMCNTFSGAGGRDRNRGSWRHDGLDGTPNHWKQRSSAFHRRLERSPTGKQRQRRSRRAGSATMETPLSSLPLRSFHSTLSLSSPLGIDASISNDVGCTPIFYPPSRVRHWSIFFHIQSNPLTYGTNPTQSKLIRVFTTYFQSSPKNIWY